MESFLGRLTRNSTGPSNESGFRLIPNPGHALDARLQLIRRAEQSIDAQYYYIANDESGHAYLEELRLAAARGVKVRLLVDDLHTANIDDLLIDLAEADNFQVRLFNPFCCARQSLVSRLIASALDLGRLNQRMHNKLMVVDGVMAIAGGRNIADEYFSKHSQEEFLDLDILVAGPVVSQLAVIFSRYWNSEPAWEVKQMRDGRGAAPSYKVGEHPDGRFAARKHPLLRGHDLLAQVPIGHEIAEGRLSLFPGMAYAFADAPEKVLKHDADYLRDAGASSHVRGAFETARDEVSLSSPYFVPGTTGMQTMRSLSQRGVGMVILTNSLASNDSVFAHAGYARYRKDMIRLGAKIFELKPLADVYARSGGKPRDETEEDSLDERTALFLSRLHAKTAVIDRETVYIGSINLDPRSFGHNTELGLLIQSPELARQVLHVLERARTTSSYAVTLNGDDRLGWTDLSNKSSEPVITEEPRVSFGTWLQNIILAPLVPESLL
ncbi:MAG: phospholipase D family protein [Polaromonas sp.]|nr:phospholipase D family protein [Polaromonas sp.]